VQAEMSTLEDNGQIQTRGHVCSHLWWTLKT